MKGSWKTTLGGVFGAFLLLAGPQVGARLTGEKEAPPVTSGSLITAATLAYLGWQAKDKDKTGGTR